MTFEADKNTNVASPCTRNCCLNTDDVCLGCFRHINEILAWKNYKNHEKNKVIKTCEHRRVTAQEK
ncbi:MULTISPECIES: DUF1289 domain-containing protein [unclassified Colwellia]|uniref:DUF1289 domain-containing protein n=1 Tax=unclassified Colwellia TaxID=196834 RepID=UPI0015F7183E|nr:MULTISPECIES: DUF1289 domain-containing protein [unclassified Colwellia]MBA6234313.1 DUF1289 domain-containing protein [Colwellia sp. MB02u-7]MBA6237481.1 DUF1289 domain-containing protein [Colwellia sp. MB02u-11]MBA6256324.1 DUF1289 domain-containing protein [Colwellia sp. MB3u-28]MBA6260208.1 DUF1289 domain-containing protein [Colwellia sp. MB3u-41]MBA6300113.1 DUF1289 domain-containing protein [Colwellia sp. MB3u-22]